MNTINIQKITDILSSEGCSDIYLFGSHVRGCVTEHSDIDVGVRGLLDSRFFAVHAALEQELDTEVDLVDFDDCPDFFRMLNTVGELRKIG